MKKKAYLAITIFVLGSFLAGWVVYAASKQSYRGRQIEKEIEDLRAQADKIRMENTTLQEKIAYFDSDEFREKIAKEKLNLKKEDEKVVEIRPTVHSGQSDLEIEKNQGSQLADNSKAGSTQNLKNYQKWWRQFFRL